MVNQHDGRFHWKQADWFLCSGVSARRATFYPAIPRAERVMAWIGEQSVIIGTVSKNGC
jgi:hypothetical protein